MKLLLTKFSIAVVIVCALSCAPNYADYTNRDSTCKVHKVQMEKKLVALAYGEMGFDSLFDLRSKAQKVQFPNATTWVGGGCIVNDDSPRKAYVFQCSVCMSAAEQWDSLHPRKELTSNR